MFDHDNATRGNDLSQTELLHYGVVYSRRIGRIEEKNIELF